MSRLLVIVLMIVVLLVIEQAQANLRGGMSDNEARKLIAKEKAEQERIYREKRTVKVKVLTPQERKIKQLEEKRVFSSDGKMMPARRMLDVPIHPGATLCQKQWITTQKYDKIVREGREEQKQIKKQQQRNLRK
jgi:hypothetical protein